MEKNDTHRLTEENQRLKRAVDELSILNEIALSISSSQSLEQILETIVNKCRKHLMVEQVAVMLLDEKKADKPFQTMVRGWDSAQDVLPYRLDTQLTGWMLKNRKPLLINNFHEDERFYSGSQEDINIRSLLCVPLICQGQMIGIIAVFNKKTEDGFSEDNQRLLAIISAQSAQVIENTRLQEEEKEYLKMQEELKMAYTIQTNLLPTQPPRIVGYDIAGNSIPAKEVGGDYYDFITLDGSHFAFCLGDVSGKGMPAALLMSNLQATLHGQAKINTSASDCLANCNTMLFHNTPPEKFATFFYGILDNQEHQLEYANAGHNYPYLFDGGSDYSQLDDSSMVLGCLESALFTGQRITFKPGDFLVIFSDGISEAINEKEEEFGEEYVKYKLRTGRVIPQLF